MRSWRSWRHVCPRRAQRDCANWNSEGFFATADAADVCACLRAGADPGARGRDGHTPLHIVALGGNAAAIAALLEAGADPGARAWNGVTPLHNAALNGNAATIAALLEAGADPGARAWNLAAPTTAWTNPGRSRRAGMEWRHPAAQCCVERQCRDDRGVAQGRGRSRRTGKRWLDPAAPCCEGRRCRGDCGAARSRGRSRRADRGWLNPVRCPRGGTDRYARPQAAERCPPDLTGKSLSAGFCHRVLERSHVAVRTIFMPPGAGRKDVPSGAPRQVLSRRPSCETARVVRFRPGKTREGGEGRPDVIGLVHRRRA